MDAMSRPDIDAHQLQRLGQVEYLSDHSPYYQKVFKEHHISSADFKSLNDLKQIPFTDKYQAVESQERNPPFGDILCVPEMDIVKYLRTRGTTLAPRNFAYSDHDWGDITVEMMVRLTYAAGVRPDDLFQFLIEET